ncbi:MAG: hypothetical protein ACRDT4_19205 [Micromonosporaceae bacterium]
MTTLAAALPHRISDPADIPPEQVYEGLLHLLALPPGPARDVMLGSVLTGLLLRGPRPDEVEAAVRAALSLDQPVPQHRPPKRARVVGYTGSGKKAFKTFNISTAASLVAAAGGAHVAKLGSHSASSVTGSRDFMQHVGALRVRVPAEDMCALTVELGFGFFSIEDRIPEFDHRYGGRFQSIHALSLGLPALLSPIECDSFVYGLAHPAVGTSAALLTSLGMTDISVVSSEMPGGRHVDELLPGGTVRTCRLVSGAPDLDIAASLTTAVAGHPFEPSSVAQHGDARRNVSRALRVLAGRGTSGAADAVALNAALLMTVSGVATSFSDGVKRARHVVSSDAALDVLITFIRATGGSDAELWSLLDDTEQTSVGTGPGREMSCSLVKS